MVVAVIHIAHRSCHVLKAELNSKTSVTVELNLFFIALTSSSGKDLWPY